MAADDYAILVGVTKYLSLPFLNAPECDVRRFKEWLLKDSGGAVPRGNITPIVTSMYDLPDPMTIGNARPSSLDLMDALAELSLKPRRTIDGKIGNRLYLYFSGHGFEPLLGEHTAMFTACAKLPEVADCFPALDLAIEVWRSGVFKQVVLVLDCCRSFIPIQYSKNPGNPFDINTQSASLGQLYLACATGAGEAAQEPPEADAQRQTPIGSYFTEALVTALDCARGNALGQVTGEQLRNTLFQIWQPLQTQLDLPSPELRWQAGGDLVWLKRSRPAATDVRFQVPGAPDGGALEVRDGDLNILGILTIQDEEASTSIENGLFRVDLQGTQRTSLFQVPGASDVKL